MTIEEGLAQKNAQNGEHIYHYTDKQVGESQIAK